MGHKPRSQSSNAASGKSTDLSANKSWAKLDAEILAERLKVAFGPAPEISEKKMFGGTAMMVRGNMTVGTLGADLMVRVGKERYQEVQTMKYASALKPPFRPMRGFIQVDKAGIKSSVDLKRWIDIAMEFNGGLPAK